MKKFRLLRADEIDCRVAMVKNSGLSLLLYKDARCDMNILDEEVGQENWQRSHSRDNANCTVSIWDDSKKQWISKEDTGTESNTEKEKGLHRTVSRELVSIGGSDGNCIQHHLFGFHQRSAISHQKEQGTHVTKSSM